MEKEETYRCHSCGEKEWHENEHGGYCAACGREMWAGSTPKHRLRDIVPKKK